MASKNSDKPIIRIGSRQSQLALIQTELVLKELSKAHPSRKFEVVSMSTKGDEVLDRALSKIGDKALFTKELEIALCNKSVDLVVHSLKDLPTTLPKNLVIGAICKREEPCDAVVLHPKHKDVKKIGNLPDGSVIGTSSIRRRAQLKKSFPHLVFKDIRGNLNTRFSKLEDHNTYDAIVLAFAGIERMGWKDKISHCLTADECMHAVGQGALAVECRDDDEEMLEIISPLRDLPTVLCCVAERAFLNTLEGGCSVPIAVTSSIEDEKLTLRGAVYSYDGSEEISDEIGLKFVDNYNCQNGTPPKKMKIVEDFNNNFVGVHSGDSSCTLKLKQAQGLGIELAYKLKARGAEEILSQAKLDNEKNDL